MYVIYLLYGIDCVHGQEISVYKDRSNLYKYIPTPGTSVGNVQYLGTFETTDECVHACISHKDGKCLTFTFYSPL